MPKLNKILWSIGILFIVSTTLVFSFGILLIGAGLLSVYGLYRHFFPKKKRPPIYHSRSQMFTFGEVIDLKSEVVHETIEVKRIDK
ncbi:hypothetical protein [Desulfosporosinus sp.]|uniref:hypothetical protein n=1 Tax=Desulfosporosinus sp. TaxID=157907 RepID=UPI000E875B96|nr:hypothetical protein [Desulfosporosinus sp.]MBC2725112.1 hypothetical protein [Desulfosporosinus sp.]HBV87921.1 hypothetical protein [Desulfosporosinus sp.]